MGKPRFLRQQSNVNVQGLQAIQYHELSHRLGRLNDDSMARIREALTYIFDL